MKPAARSIVVKALLNADEFLEFDAACKSADKPHSKALRDLAKDWTAYQHDRRRLPSRQWPSAGQQVAMRFPGHRMHYGAMRL